MINFKFYVTKENLGLYHKKYSAPARLTQNRQGYKRILVYFEQIIEINPM